MIQEKGDTDFKTEERFIEDQEDDDFEEFDNFGKLISLREGYTHGDEEYQGRRVLAGGLGR